MSHLCLMVCAGQMVAACVCKQCAESCLSMCSTGNKLLLYKGESQPESHCPTYSVAQPEAVPSLSSATHLSLHNSVFPRLEVSLGGGGHWRKLWGTQVERIINKIRQFIFMGTPSQIRFSYKGTKNGRLCECLLLWLPPPPTYTPTKLCLATHPTKGKF